MHAYVYANAYAHAFAMRLQCVCSALAHVRAYVPMYTIRVRMCMY